MRLVVQVIVAVFYGASIWSASVFHEIYDNPDQLNTIQAGAATVLGDSAFSWQLYSGSAEIGVYALLTNSYCLVSPAASENFYSIFQGRLERYIPVIHCTIGNAHTIGVDSVGNSRGLLVSRMTTDQELLHLRNSLPDSVVVQRVDDRLGCLGNIIACNDSFALVHPEIDRDTEEIIADVLRVRVIRCMVGGTPMLGSFVKITNVGGLVHPEVTVDELNILANTLGIPVTAGTVNRGSSMVGKGIMANDWTVFCGDDTTAPEIVVIEAIFKIQNNAPLAGGSGIQNALIEMLA